jgi:hypothetical protein
MKYHAPTKCFVIEPRALEGAALHLRYAMRCVRELGGFPLEPHKRETHMTKACHAEKALIDLAGEIGIDMGGTWPGTIDLRDKP